MKKRSVKIAGHATSISLEDEFWDELQRIAENRGMAIRRLIEDIDNSRTQNLSSAIRLFILKELKKTSE